MERGRINYVSRVAYTCVIDWVMLMERERSQCVKGRVRPIGWVVPVTMVSVMLLSVVLS